MSSLAEVTRELTRADWAISPPAGRAIAISRLQSVSLPPVDMIAVDVRLCDSISSDLTQGKHTEVVLVLPPRNNDKPARCLPNLPIFVPIVTLLQVAISVYYVGVMRNDIITIISSPLVFSPFRQTELWRFVTYMFVHDGLAHIALNTMFQMSIGIPLEGIHGWRKIIIVYVVGGAIGVMLGSNWHPFSYSMGSSGAIFVMLGCLFVTALFHPDLPSLRYRFGIAFLCFIVVMCSVLQAELLFTDQDSTLKTHIAHGNSLIIGIPLAILFLRIFKGCKVERNIRIATGILFGCVVAALAIRSFSFYFNSIAGMEEPWITFCRQEDDGSLRNDTSVVSPSC